MAYNGNYGQGDYGGDFGQGDYNRGNFEMKAEQFEGPSDWSNLTSMMNFGNGNGNDFGGASANPMPEEQLNADLPAPKDDKKKSRRSRSGR